MSNATKGLRLIFTTAATLGGLYAGGSLGADVVNGNPHAELRDIFIFTVATAIGGAITGHFASNKISDYIRNRIAARQSACNPRPAEEPDSPVREAPYYQETIRKRDR